MRVVCVSVSVSALSTEYVVRACGVFECMSVSASKYGVVTVATAVGQNFSPFGFLKKIKCI